MKYYHKNKDKYLEYNRVAKKANKAKLDELKRTLKCTDCGMSFLDEPYLCDFHHLKNKTLPLAHMCRTSWKRVLEELKKCIPLCCICHRRRHVKEGFHVPKPIDEVGVYNGFS